MAIKKRSFKLIQPAIDDGAELDATDANDFTASAFLCKSKRGAMSKPEVDAALWLVERGADVMKPNSDTETPMHLAAASVGSP